MGDKSDSKASGQQSSQASASDKQQWPKLSAADFRAYNTLAERMELFHNRFRQSWTTLYDACQANRRPQNLSLNQFIRIGLDLCQHLDAHHRIEEQYIFPILAKKMTAFRNELELLDQHKQIHKGMDVMEEYLAACKSGGRELRLVELKSIMDGFGKVLWEHLDDEVRELGAENMRKYWSLEEMKGMPM